MLQRDIRGRIHETVGVGDMRYHLCPLSPASLSHLIASLRSRERSWELLKGGGGGGGQGSQLRPYLSTARRSKLAGLYKFDATEHSIHAVFKNLGPEQHPTAVCLLK